MASLITSLTHILTILYECMKYTNNMIMAALYTVLTISFILTFAPLFTRRATVSVLPRRAALCRGVLLCIIDHYNVYTLLSLHVTDVDNVNFIDFKYHLFYKSPITNHHGDIKI